MLSAPTKDSKDFLRTCDTDTPSVLLIYLNLARPSNSKPMEKAEFDTACLVLFLCLSVALVVMYGNDRQVDASRPGGWYHLVGPLPMATGF